MYLYNKLSVLILIALCTIGQIHADPLPSWNEGPSKRAILEFVQKTFHLPPEKKIAVFDQDGTLWVEKPIFAQFFFAADRFKAFAEKHPELKNQDAFQRLLNTSPETWQDIPNEDLKQILDSFDPDTTTNSYTKEVSEWLKTAIHPRFKRPFTELVYQPMLEVIQLLRNHHFKVYIVSGGGLEFIRAYAEQLYGIPPEQVIGTAPKTKYIYQNGKPALLILPELLFFNDHAGKAESINLVIGKHPTAAFGNSTGDQEMLEWTQANENQNFELLVYHDDPVREYAYNEKARFGRFSQALMDEAKTQGWHVVSMKNDWKVIFPWELPERLPHNQEQNTKIDQECLRECLSTYNSHE